jgi:hypothetical protein
MAEINRNVWDRASNSWRRLVDSASISWSTPSPGVASASVIPPATPFNVQVFTASATYTPSAGMRFCRIRVQAPGGGSGGADGAGAEGSGVASGGGGAGEYAEGFFTAASIGASQTVTIGARGAAGSTTGGNGGTGGTTSVGSLITAIGGSGGTGTGSNSTDPGPRAGGAGGAGGTGGTLRIPGQAGESSDIVTDEATFALLKRGKGGDSFLGRGVPPGPFDNGTPIAASAGPNYGAGATGAYASSDVGVAGALGGAGIVVIEEFF